jgi:hypothetical protein
VPTMGVVSEATNNSPNPYCTNNVCQYF